MLGHYMGRARNITKIDVSFNGDATMDATIDVISQARPRSTTPPRTGIRSDGKDPTKHTINARSQTGRPSERRRNHWTVRRLQS